MSVALRLNTGEEAASQAAPLADETMPGVLLPPDPALLDWASLLPAADSHLAPCPQCGLPNGLSASSCWSCEAKLLPLKSSRRRLAPRPSLLAPTHVPADAPVHAPIHADESLPVLTSAVEGNHPMAERSMTAVHAWAPVPVQVSAANARRNTWQTGASILVVAGIAVGALLYLEFPASAPAPIRSVRSGGVVYAPEPAPLTNARSAPAELADDVGVGNAPTAADEPRAAALRALALEPDTPTVERTPQSAAPATAPIDVAIPRSATQPAATSTLKASHAGKARGTSRALHVATAPAVPKPDRPDPSWQAPAPVRAACTPTVAALGLCAAPPTQSKE